MLGITVSYHQVENFAEEGVAYMCIERSVLSFGLVKIPEKPNLAKKYTQMYQCE